MKKTKVIIFIIMIFISINTIILGYTNDGRTVYITDNESKYHALGCDMMKDAPRRTTIYNAERYGYSPCKVCNPYGRATEFYGMDNSNNNYYIILGLVIMSFSYFALPMYFKIKKSTWYSYKDLRQFIVLNSLLVSIILTAITYGRNVNFGNIVGVFFIGSTFALLNYKLLEKNVEI